jgi:hypothetical protein
MTIGKKKISRVQKANVTKKIFKKNQKITDQF